MSRIAEAIDHTLLNSNIERSQIETLCKEAIEHQFAAVCLPPYYVPFAHSLLHETPVKIATVIGFPMGYSTLFAKVEEIKRAVNDGADELDVVLNLSAVKDENWNYVNNEIQSFTRAAHLKGKTLKLIIEASVLSDEALKKICEIASREQVDFIKTSSGFQGGATPEMVSLIKKHLDSSIKLKASGGIKTLQQAIQLMDAGAQRLGTSSAISILGEAE